jgi:hypothetical protein
MMDAARPASCHSESFEHFRQLVFRDRALQEALRATSELERFIELVVELGRERGYDFTADDVKSALDASRRAWSERWL